jgi:hypothetical protein
MFFFRNLRTGTGFLAIAALMLLFSLSLGGCSDNEISPTQTAVPEPPVLPVAEQLAFDFSFFADAPQLDKATGQYDNFINAYLRTAMLDVMAHLVLAAPVSAFSAAVHTVPVVQDDSSWVWTYDWQHRDGMVRIILRGLPVGDAVQWELSLAPGGAGEGILWFDGSTNGDASEGHWSFRDLDTEDYPISGEINWGVGYLAFVSREADNEGGRLRFIDNDPDFRIEFSDGNGGGTSFIKWNASGSGSLLVPDYNGGQEACWDQDLRDTVCN